MTQWTTEAFAYTAGAVEFHGHALLLLPPPALPALAHVLGMRLAHCRRHPARGRRLARVARPGAARRLERDRACRHVSSGRPPVTLAHADSRGLFRARRRCRPRVRHRLPPHQGATSAIERALALDEQTGPSSGRASGRPTTAACSSSMPSARARRRPWTAIASTSSARWATCWRSTCRRRNGLAEGLRRGLQCFHPVVGHGRRAARRRRSA